MLLYPNSLKQPINQFTEVHFASFLSGGFTSAMVVINPTEKKLAKRISVQFSEADNGGFHLVDLIITELKSHMTC